MRLATKPTRNLEEVRAMYRTGSWVSDDIVLFAGQLQATQLMAMTERIPQNPMEGILYIFNLAETVRIMP